jgi:uncharacterized protein
MRHPVRGGDIVAAGEARMSRFRGIRASMVLALLLERIWLTPIPVFRGDATMPGHFELLKGDTGAFRFNLKADNNHTILTSESYRSKAGAQNGIESVKKNAGADERYERRVARDGSPYFVLRAANKEVIGKSEMYSSTRQMEGGIASVKRNAADADVKDKTS